LPPLPQPKPKPPPLPPAKEAERPAAMSLHQAKIPGPSATRDEYVNYCFMLIQRHAGLLSPMAIGNRRGEAVIVFEVHDDGRISAIEVGQSSGYPDIDHRVEEMVAAVGRFPPLPQWFQGDAFHFTLTQIFPSRGG
jgi:TonB family protein